MKPRFLSLLFLLTALLPLASRAQLNPPNLPEQDPCGAIPLCGTSFSSPNSYQGVGVGGSIAGVYCTPEANSMWLKVTVIGAGSIVFTISPNNVYDDYDFIVFNGTTTPCGSLGQANAIRCNANNNNPGSNVNGQVGLNSTSTITTVPGGTFGSSYLQQITAAVGDVYYICINNFGNYAPNPTGPVSGFNINFAGSTAVFGGSVQPEYDSVKKTCNSTTGITVVMNTPVKCSSIAANGSDFEILPSLATVSAAAGTGCTPAGNTTEIALTFSTALPPGNYILRAKTGTDGNTLLNTCSVPQAVGDTVAFVVVAPLTVNAGADTTICTGQSLVLVPTITGGYNNSILWSPATYLNNTTIASPTSTPTGDVAYTLTVTPAGLPQCAKSDQINVLVLQGFDIANNDTTICKGSVVNLTINGDQRYNFQWLPTTNLTNPNSPNTVAQPDTTTLYTLIASHPGCPDSAQQVRITVEPVPTVSIGADRTLCYGDTAQMIPLVQPSWYQNYQYSWTPAQYFDRPTDATPVFTGYDSVQVVLTVTTSAGCTGQDDAIFDVEPVNFVTTSSDTALCPRAVATLGVGGAVSYVWSPNLNISATTGDTVRVDPVTSGYYTVIGTNQYNCKDTQQIYVTVHPDANVRVPDTVLLYPGQAYRFDPQGNGLYFSWYPQVGLSDANVSNPLAQPTVNTRYYVTARTEYGCIASDSVEVLVKATLLNMPNAFSPGSEPNGVFKVSKMGIASIRNFQIYDRWGQKVFETKNIDEGWDGRLNGEPQPMGVYIYMVEAVTDAGNVFKQNGNVTLIR